MSYTFSEKISSLQPSAIREILKFTADPTVISLAAGNPAPEAFPVEAIAKITADIFAENPIGALQYSISEGHMPLRIALVKMLKERYNTGTDTDELIVVSGAQQGVEMTCKILCNDGDTVLCENPSFIGSLNAFRSYSCQLVGVDIESDGIDTVKLEQALIDNPRTKLLYLIPNFQNPSGITMSLEKRKEVLRLAEQYNVIILEDNPYGDLRFEGEAIPSIKSLDTTGRVIYCGSFSKVISPGLRVGYLLAHRELIAKLVVAKQCSDVHTNILAQMICERFITQYDFVGHMDKNREIYKQKCRLMLDQIQKNFAPSVRYTVPQGGLFIWCTLPDGVDVMEFCRKAVESKVAVVPGTAFTAVEGEPSQSFRLNFSTPTDENIIKGIEILGKLTKEL